MNISYEGIGHFSVTFPATDCAVGAVCKMGSDGKMTGCADGDKFCGVAEVVTQEAAAVQVGGFATVSYTGTAPAAGYVNLCADGNGGVKAGQGKEYLVAAVDETAMTVTIML